MTLNRVLRLLAIVALLAVAAYQLQNSVSAGSACGYDSKKHVCIDHFCTSSQGQCVFAVPPDEGCLCQLAEE